MNAITPILMGVSLAACAGLRAFLPLLALGVGVRMGWMPVQPWLEWAGSNEALITFGVATLLELLADKVPVLDHALDTFHTFARPVAGALVAMGAFSQVSPEYATVLGIILGAPIAGGFHLAKAGTRVVSTTTTAGFGNPVLSIIEDIVAFVGVVMALLAPVLAAIGVLLIGVFTLRWLRGRRWRNPLAGTRTPDPGI